MPIFGVSGEKQKTDADGLNDISGRLVPHRYEGVAGTVTTEEIKNNSRIAVQAIKFNTAKECSRTVYCRAVYD